jgi:metal-sulfur cluster biosynthetic enzyme
MSDPTTIRQPEAAADAASGAAPSVDDITEAMRDVVDLGLLYGVTIGERNDVTLDMTLTSAACPLTDVIEDQAISALEGLAADVRINWVWMPPWGPDKITDEGREQLRALGFNV